MAETQKKKKRKKRQLVVTDQVQDEAVQNAIEVCEVLEELEKEKKQVDIQVCPNCKSPLVRRVGDMVGDMSAWMGFTPPKYECKKCGWRERTVLKATNKPTTVRDVVIMAETKDAVAEEKQRNKKRNTIRSRLGF